MEPPKENQYSKIFPNIVNKNVEEKFRPDPVNELFLEMEGDQKSLSKIHSKCIDSALNFFNMGDVISAFKILKSTSNLINCYPP